MQQLIKLFGLILKKFRILFLKIPKFSEFAGLGSRLFQSSTAKKFLQKLCLVLKRRIFSAFLIKCEGDFRLRNFCKTFLAFSINVVIGVTLYLVLGRAFLLMCLVWFQLWPSRHYFVWIPVFGEKTFYMLKDITIIEMGSIKIIIYCDNCHLI